MSQPLYDVIVVGARMAGSATAALLAQQGARVLLLERSTLPAPTVSCPIIYGNSLQIFDEMGVLPAVEAIGAPKIRYYGGRVPNLDLVARLPAVFGRDYAYSIRRDVLDTVVLNEVKQMPSITVREGFNVTELVWGNGRVVGVRGRQNGGALETIYGWGVVGADGKRSKVAREVQAPIYLSHPNPSCIFYAYYRNFEPLSEPSAVVYADPERLLTTLVFDADAGLTVVSVGVPNAEFATARKDPEGTLRRVIDAFPEVQHRARNAERVTKVMGQGPIDSYYRQSYGAGWALVGDAGHYVDPVTGQGINYALYGAAFLAQAWARTRRRASWEQAMAEYQRNRDAYTRPMFNLISFGSQAEWLRELGIDIGTPLMQAISRRPDVMTRYIGMYNGATSVDEFMHPLNLLRIYAEDQLLYGLPQALGLRGGATRQQLAMAS